MKAQQSITRHVSRAAMLHRSEEVVDAWHYNAVLACGLLVHRAINV